MKKVFKIIFIIFVVVALIITGVVIFLKVSISERFVPQNLLSEAPNRILTDVSVDLSNPLQKRVTGGVILGYHGKADDIEIYKGVPYAAPPVGELRWKDAQEPKPWQGVRDCTLNSPNPIQGDNEMKAGEYGAETVPDPSVGYSEDCLYLNIWTNGAATEKMPVVFYIPGGAWVGGGCSVENYDGEYLASQHVLFVSINYRLGIFGWLASDALAAEAENGSTGNYGLSDIIKALEWVQDNIATFGGDPNNITLYGGSAGGNLIDLLMVSPKAEGLFHNAVSMSYPLDMISPAWDKTFKTNLGNKLIPDADALEKMRGKSVKELMSNGNAIAAYAFSGPTLDGIYLDMQFADAVANGRGKEINYITGFNYNDDIPMLDGNPTGDAAFCSMIGTTPEGASNGDLLRSLYYYVAKSRLKGGGKENTWILQFGHPAPGPTQAGAVHGGDLQYMLNYFSPNRQNYWTDSDYNMGVIASSYFINFCRTGNPNGETAEGKPLPVWTVYNGNAQCFYLDNKAEMRSMQNVELVSKSLWEEKGYSFVKPEGAAAESYESVNWKEH